MKRETKEIKKEENRQLKQTLKHKHTLTHTKRQTSISEGVGADVRAAAKRANIKLNSCLCDTNHITGIRLIKGKMIAGH